MERIFTLITTPTYIFFILLELYISHRERLGLYNFKETKNSLLLGLGGMVVDILMKGVTFFILDGIAMHSPFWGFWQEHPVVAWVGVFIAQDFCFYWLHRAEHYCRILWAVHSNHHSAELYNFTVALRSSMFQPLYRYLFYIPAAMVGFDGIHIMFIYAVNQAYQFFLHTETVGKLGVFEKFFVTPSHHRVHHASNIAYLDKNMGQVLIIWDKLFGTYAEEKEEDPTRFGLTKPLPSQRFVDVAFDEWKKIGHDLRRPGLSWKDRFNYLFAPPGWSHDGSTLTSSQLRKEMEQESVSAGVLHSRAD
ncbi:sterol desaturase family protein [Siphonobacter aquaeclarae]|nr:sterol desaturase family protein [Siphonobacter aquaeclarae]